MLSVSELLIVEWIIIVCGYVFLLSASGPVVREVASYIKGEEGDEVDPIPARAGKVIGKCENLLALTFFLAGAYTGLAVIFAAEGVISLEYDDERYPDYFLAGTMVNLTLSVSVGLAVRLLLELI